MANLSNVKIGNSDSTEILYDTYYNPKANQNLIFGSLIPKDNTKIWNSVYGEWQVNEDWEIEIISPKRIAIKKFRIDTWGIRKIWNQGGANDTDSFIGSKSWNNFPIRVRGLDYVHNHVVYKEDSNGNRTYGFGKAFCGNGGYNVYWYPGQFTTGSSIQGLGIQSCIGYTANQNEIDDSFCMGKHPWDIGTVVNVTDGDITGKGSDGSYKATCIGLWGGYQTATSWHEYKQEGYTGNAYKVWDISDTPIIIDLNVPDTTTPTDVTSVECWDIYAGYNQVYHKDRTRDNCWKKYGLLFPESFNLYRGKLTISDTNNCKWKDSKTLMITRIPDNGINIVKNTTVQNTESVNINYIGFILKVNNVPDNVYITFSREFTNLTTYPGNGPLDYSDAIYDIVEGETSISPYKGKFYLINKNNVANLTEFKLNIVGKTDDCNLLIEICPIYDNGWVKLIPKEAYPQFSKIIIPEVVDKLDGITKTLWTCAPYNIEFWDSIKEWFENNDAPAAIVQRQTFANSNIDEITLRFNEWLNDEKTNPTGFMWANKPFNGSTIKKINIVSVNGCTFSSANSLFFGPKKLEEITFTPNTDTTNNKISRNWLLGATDMSGVFSFCGVPTYPANLINWGAYRSNAFDNGIPCTLSGYALDYSDMVTMPVFNNGNRDADENRWVFTKFAAQTFNGAGKLVSIGPVLDLILVRPNSGANNIFNCWNLEDVRIKNLNHGNWNFDGVTRNGVTHGNLSKLDAASIQYLFANLIDLNTYNPEVHENRIDKAFISWDSNYKGSWGTEFWDSRVAVRYFESKKRNPTGVFGNYIASTTGKFTNMLINITGLQEGDSIVFGKGSITEIDNEFNSNGTHYVNKVDDSIEGFMLFGNPENDSIVRVTIENGLDYTNPDVNSAILYCPAQWEDKITTEMISSANAKGWKVFIDNVEVQP